MSNGIMRKLTQVVVI